MTFVELMLALIIVGLVMTAAYTLLAGTLNTDRYLSTANTTESEVELAIRRLTNNLRTAAPYASMVPAAGTAVNTVSTTLTVQTQPDPNNSNQQYVVTYSVNASHQLIENDSRYGSGAAANNVLCNNVASFQVMVMNSSAPMVLQVTLTTSAPQPVSRVFQIMCRNF
jgi:type II secretory pathway pseudopilin PulG